MGKAPMQGHFGASAARRSRTLERALASPRQQPHESIPVVDFFSHTFAEAKKAQVPARTFPSQGSQNLAAARAGCCTAGVES